MSDSASPKMAAELARALLTRLETNEASLTLASDGGDDDDEASINLLTDFPIHAADPIVFRLARNSLREHIAHTAQARTLIDELAALCEALHGLTSLSASDGVWSASWHADADVFALRDRLIAAILKRIDVGAVLMESGALADYPAVAAIRGILTPELLRPSWHSELPSLVADSLRGDSAPVAALCEHVGSDDREAVTALMRWLHDQSELEEARSFAAAGFRGEAVERRLWPAVDAAVRARSSPPSVLVIGGAGWTARRLLPLAAKVSLLQPNSLLAQAAAERCEAARVPVLRTVDADVARQFDFVVLVGWSANNFVGRMLQLLAPFQGRADVTVVPRTVRLEATLALQDTLQDVCGIDFQTALSPLMGMSWTSARAVSRHPTDAQRTRFSTTTVAEIDVLQFVPLRRLPVEFELAGVSEVNCVVLTARAIDAGVAVVLSESAQAVRHTDVSGRAAFALQFHATREHVWFDHGSLPRADERLLACPWATQFVAAWHFQMLRDAARNEAFRDALRQSAAGRCVIDAGAGPTGLLSLFAVQSGASACTAIEIVPHIFRLAQRCVKSVLAPADAARIALYNDDALHFTRRVPQADLLVAELLDAAGVGEHYIAVVRGARAQNLLAPDARIMPARLRLYARPIELCAAAVLDSELLAAAILSADSSLGQYAGIRFDGSDGLAEGSGWRALAAPELAFDIDFERDSLEMPLECDVTFPLASDGRCNAVMWWFEAWLDRDGAHRVTNAPGARITHWAQAAALLPETRAARGASLTLQARTDGKTVRWLMPQVAACAVPAPSDLLDTWRAAEKRCEMARTALGDLTAACATDTSRLAKLQRAALAIIAQPRAFGVDGDAVPWLKKQFFS
jgi:predicted RNA methylase